MHESHTLKMHLAGIVTFQNVFVVHWYTFHLSDVQLITARLQNMAEIFTCIVTALSPTERTPGVIQLCLISGIGRGNRNWLCTIFLPMWGLQNIVTLQSTWIVWLQRCSVACVKWYGARTITVTIATLHLLTYLLDWKCMLAASFKHLPDHVGSLDCSFKSAWSQQV